MLRSLIAALALLTTLLAVATVPADAVRVSDGPVYFVESIDLHVSEEWRSQDAGHPRRCSNWVLAEGRSNLGAAQHDPRKLTLTQSPLGAIGTVAGSDRGVSELRRTQRFRQHLRPDEAPCSPCGPSSEYGRCTGGRPDVVDNSRCSPPRGSAFVSIWLASGKLNVGAAPLLERALADCREIDDAPHGVMQWRIDTVGFPGATRKLLSLPIGGTHTFRSEKTTSRGNGCRRLAGVGYRSCIAATAVVVVHRVR